VLRAEFTADQVTSGCVAIPTLDPVLRQWIPLQRSRSSPVCLQGWQTKRRTARQRRAAWASQHWPPRSAGCSTSASRRATSQSCSGRTLGRSRCWSCATPNGALRDWDIRS